MTDDVETGAAMSPEEFRDKLQAIGLTQAGAGRLLGINERTVRSYAGGRLEVTPLVFWALRGLEAEVLLRRGLPAETLLQGAR